MILPPGTILQLMYLKERLRRRRPGTFIEVGTGQGHLSSSLLDMGWSGVGLELDPGSANAARDNNVLAIRAGTYAVIETDWIDPDATEAGLPTQADLIVSSMVLEHLDEVGEAQYFAKCAKHLTAGGLCVLFVPASMEAWGIEDEIAGHFRRYTFSRFRQILPGLGWHIDHMAGLTFPVSNILLPVSNFLVERSEASKRTLDMDSRTRASGRREVYGKTIFPDLAALILNEWMMYPFHLLQKVFADSSKSLVIYVECVPTMALTQPDLGRGQ